MKHHTYQEAVQAAINCLDEAQGHAMAAVINIAFAGPYQKLGRLYEDGEMLEIEPAAFENTGDANVDMALKVVYDIHAVMDKLQNLHGSGNQDQP